MVSPKKHTHRDIWVWMRFNIWSLLRLFDWLIVKLFAPLLSSYLGIAAYYIIRFSWNFFFIVCLIVVCFSWDALSCMYDGVQTQYTGGSAYSPIVRYFYTQCVRWVCKICKSALFNVKLFTEGKKMYTSWSQICQNLKIWVS